MASNTSKHALEAANLMDRLVRLARSGQNLSGLNPAQLGGLRYLSKANRFSRTPAALAAFTGSTRGTVSQTLIALEDKELVERVTSPVDARSVVVNLTLAGWEALASDPVAVLANAMTRAEGVPLGTLVAQLTAILQTYIANNGGRAFGVCNSCHHHRANIKPGSQMPHHCNLLNQPLSDADSLDICVEQITTDAPG